MVAISVSYILSVLCYCILIVCWLHLETTETLIIITKVPESSFSLIQISFIYMVPNHNNIHLRALYIVR